MIAITRDVAATIQDAELTHLDRTRIDYVVASMQHRQYRRLLSSLGCEVIRVLADDDHPDCVFVEDTAIVLDDVAIITRPGAESRRGETHAIAEALKPYRPLVHIEAPATIDGGDVLVTGDRIYVGLSSRTNEEGIAQLRAFSKREVIAVPVQGALHLKTAVTQIASDTLLINRDFVDASLFAWWKLIDVDPAEPMSANALLIGDVIVYPQEFPRTLERLRGFDVRTVEAGELAKAEGGVTCCALLVR